MSTQVSHEGIVCSVDREKVIVLLSQGVSCSGCRAEGSCGLPGNGEKKVEVRGSWRVKPGEKVIVSMNESQGFSALFLAYLLPLMIILVALFSMLASGSGELASGLVALAVPVPYYILLYAFRKMISKQYSFTLKPIS